MTRAIAQSHNARAAFQMGFPEGDWIARQLKRNESKLNNRIVRPSLRAMGNVYKKQIRMELRQYRRSGDLIKAIIYVERRGKRSTPGPGGKWKIEFYYYGIIGAVMNKYGKPGTTQDPAAYLNFLEHGTKQRRGRGRVTPARVFHNVTGSAGIRALAMHAFTEKFAQRLAQLT